MNEIILPGLLAEHPASGLAAFGLLSLFRNGKMRFAEYNGHYVAVYQGIGTVEEVAKVVCDKSTWLKTFAGAGKISKGKKGQEISQLAPLVGEHPWILSFLNDHWTRGAYAENAGFLMVTRQTRLPDLIEQYIPEVDSQNLLSKVWRKTGAQGMGLYPEFVVEWATKQFAASSLRCPICIKGMKPGKKEDVLVCSDKKCKGQRLNSSGQNGDIDVGNYNKCAPLLNLLAMALLTNFPTYCKNGLVGGGPFWPMPRRKLLLKYPVFTEFMDFRSVIAMLGNGQMERIERLRKPDGSNLYGFKRMMIFHKIRVAANPNTDTALVMFGEKDKKNFRKVS